MRRHRHLHLLPEPGQPQRPLRFFQRPLRPVVVLAQMGQDHLLQPIFSPFRHGLGGVVIGQMPLG